MLQRSYADKAETDKNHKHKKQYPVCDLVDGLAEFGAVLEDFLNSHRPFKGDAMKLEESTDTLVRRDGEQTHNTALMALKGLESHVFNLCLGAAEELFASCVKHLLVGTLNLNLRTTKSSMQARFPEAESLPVRCQ